MGAELFSEGWSVCFGDLLFDYLDEGVFADDQEHGYEELEEKYEAQDDQVHAEQVDGFAHFEGGKGQNEHQAADHQEAYVEDVAAFGGNEEVNGTCDYAQRGQEYQQVEGHKQHEYADVSRLIIDLEGVTRFINAFVHLRLHALLYQHLFHFLVSFN